MTVSGSVTYVTSMPDLPESALDGGFFQDWPAPPSRAQHLALLRGSSHVALALEGQKVVGFGTALSDGILSACVSLLEVLPEYRRQGIGSELVRRLLHALDGLYMVDVMCDDNVLAFYERLGFRPSGGAILRNYGWRSPR